MTAHSPRLRRSALYLPASNARAMDKARGLPADVVILDLEDSVAPEMKAEARSRAVQAVRDGGFGRREVVIRINGLDTPWGADDLAAMAAVGPDAVLAPKLERVEQARALDAGLVDAPFHTALWGMIETPRAILSLAALADAAADTRLAAFVVGTNDLAKAMNARPGNDSTILDPALTLTVMAARMAGLSVLDGVWNDLEDDAGLAAACRRASAFGFDGKTLIHPRQIDACNAAFTPAIEEVEAARRIIAAFDDPANHGRAALRVDGRMVEPLHRDMALKVVALAEIAAHET